MYTLNTYNCIESHYDIPRRPNMKKKEVEGYAEDPTSGRVKLEVGDFSEEVFVFGCTPVMGRSSFLKEVKKYARNKK